MINPETCRTKLQLNAASKNVTTNRGYAAYADTVRNEWDFILFPDTFCAFLTQAEDWESWRNNEHVLIWQSLFNGSSFPTIMMFLLYCIKLIHQSPCCMHLQYSLQSTWRKATKAVFFSYITCLWCEQNRKCSTLMCIWFWLNIWKKRTRKQREMTDASKFCWSLEFKAFMHNLSS